MRILQFGLLLALWVGSDALMGLQLFRKKFKGLCYLTKDEMSDRERIAVPHSIESFIGLVEKLERHPNEQSPIFNMEGVIRALLRNYRYDDLEYDSQGRSYSTRGTVGVTHAHEMTETIFEIGSSSFNISEVFTADEECALFFMLSHTVNSTLRENDGAIDVDIGKQNIRKEAEFPREQGVVSLGSDPFQAFSIGKVLFGLLAGLRKVETVPSVQIYKQFKPKAVEIPRNIETATIDVLFAGTFGDIVSVPYTESGGWRGEIKFQSTGYWQEIVCPIEYALNGKNRDAHGTAALIRGAIDGYALGKQINELKYGSLRLSQILRMFYSGNSFSSIPKLSVCSRDQLWNDYRPELTEKAKNYIELHMHFSDQIQDDENIINDYCKNVINTAIGRDAARIFGSEGISRCDISPSSANLQHETPIDFIAVIDYRAQNKDPQNEIIGNITSGFQMRTDSSSVSVFTNLRPTKQGYDMDTVVNRSHVSGCGSCAAKYYEPRAASSTENEFEVIRDLNRTLTSMTAEDEDKNGVPGKVILYFNFQNPSSDYQTRHEIWQLQYHFREASLFAIGTSKLSLEQFVRDKDRDVFVTSNANPNTETLVKDLRKRVNTVPAVFQYKNCDRQPSREETYEGFISMHRYQYWAMYPKYFLKSYEVTLTFKALSGAFKVCYSRNYGAMFDSTPPREGNCRDVTSGGEPVNFYENNPCKKRDLQSCEPFYFYLEGKTMPQAACGNMKCDPEQIQFQFSHKGISCNSASSLSAGLAFSVLLAFALLFYQQKM